MPALVFELNNFATLRAKFRKLYWRFASIINNVDSSVDGVAVAYKTANLLFQTTSDKFLHMRHLYEELKPETQSLIKQCSGPAQLERSMIAQRKEPVQTSSTGSVFQPACGFTFRAPAPGNQTDALEEDFKTLLLPERDADARSSE
jgi:hypothetical protein